MIKHIDDLASIQEEIKNNEIVLLDFYANWCGPCQMLIPVLEEIDEQKLVDNLTIIKINADNAIEVCNAYRVMSIPALFLYKNGELKNNSLGYMNKAQLLNFINK